MSLNPDFMIAPNLQEYFVDKLLGTPLSGGMINFWIDSNRSVRKAIYTLSGSPPNYTYTQLPNPLELSSVGTPQDGLGNDIIIYYYPFDADGNIELYFIEVFDSDGNPQFTRQGWPNITEAAAGEQGSDAFNYVPNGQFLLHNNIPAVAANGFSAGKLTQPTTLIAEGGWQFIRPSGSTASDFVFFPRFGAYVADPTGSPRYAVQVQCLGANPADSYKSLRIQFNDVNKFASSTQTYTFAFSAISNAANILLPFNLVKNFGTGGDPQTITTQSTFLITNIQGLFSFSFTFGDNSGDTIGTLNDDFVALDLSFPTNLTYDVTFTDFMLLFGSVTVTNFPTQTNRDFVARSLVAPAPDPNGLSLGLPLIQTQDGLTYDNSLIGQVVATIRSTAPYGYLPCDGSSYFTAGYSSDNIPYVRLQQYLMNPVPGTFPTVPIFGTGASYVTAYKFTSSSNLITLATNQSGAQSATADGVNPTGFTFNTVVTGTTFLGFISYIYGSANSLWILCSSIGTVSGTIGSGTSGFTMNAIPNPQIGERIGDPFVQQLVSVTVGSLPTAGTYFRISNPTTQYYVWFRIDGVGTDPAPGGVGIRVDLLSSMSTIEVAYSISLALSAFQLSVVGFTSGASIPANSYFTFNANSQLYYVWYSLNGTGTDPMVAGGAGIPVSYQTTDSALTILNNTVFAINKLYFATPDLRGITIKGWDSTGNIDANTAYRYALNTQLLPNYIGTSQFDYLLNHTHTLINYTLNTPTFGQSLQPANTNNTTPQILLNNALQTSGTAQNDVKNIYLNYIIKY